MHPTTEPRGRAIHNVALLDLTGAQADSALDGVTRISNVATILVPERLLPKLTAIPMDNVAATVPVRDGQRTRVMAGQIILSGEALANVADGTQDDMLVVAGQLILTSPLHHVGYKDLVLLGQVIAPTGSETAIAGVSRLSGQALYYQLPDNASVRVGTSGTLSGDALANTTGAPGDVLLVLAQLVITSEITRIGYQQVIGAGHVVVPRVTNAEVLERFSSLGGQVTTYTAPPRVFEGKDHFSAGLFELFDSPITLVLDGKFSFDEDIEPDLLRRAVAGIVLDGKIRAPKRLVPMLQLLCVARDGKIQSFDEPE